MLKLALIIVAKKKSKLHISCKDSLNGVSPFGKNHAGLTQCGQYHHHVKSICGMV